MIDPEDTVLPEVLAQNRVELARGIAIVAERFFDHQPGVVGASRLGELSGHHAEQAGRNREIMHRLLRTIEHFV